MTLYLTWRGYTIQARIRADAQGIVGDALLLIRPGTDAFGMTYDALARLTPGEVEVPEEAPEARG